MCEGVPEVSTIDINLPCIIKSFPVRRPHMKLLELNFRQIIKFIISLLCSRSRLSFVPPKCLQHLPQTIAKG